MAGIEHVFKHPLGVEPFVVSGQGNFAHNLWIDTGIRGGILSMLCLIVIAIKIIRLSVQIVRCKLFTVFERKVFTMLSVGFMMQLMVEPILQGSPQYFALFIFYWSVLTALMRHRRRYGNIGVSYVKS